MKLVELKNIFDPLFPYIHITAFFPAEGTIAIRIVVPPDLLIDTDLLQEFMADPTLRVGTMKQREISGVITDRGLAEYIWGNEEKTAKVSYCFAMPIRAADPLPEEEGKNLSQCGHSRSKIKGIEVSEIIENK